jgi:hypothetical protein
MPVVVCARCRVSSSLVPQGGSYETPGTTVGPTDPLQRGSEPQWAQRYTLLPPTQSGNPLSNSAPKDQIQYNLLPGFMTLQLMVDR